MHLQQGSPHAMLAPRWGMAATWNLSPKWELRSWLAVRRRQTGRQAHECRGLHAASCMT